MTVRFRVPERAVGEREGRSNEISAAVNLPHLSHFYWSNSDSCHP